MSKYIKSENVKFKVSHVVYALIAAVAAFATGGAWAEDVYWKGGSGGTEADPLILNTSNYTNASGEARGVPNDLNFSVSSLTYITNTASITTRVVNDFNVNSGDFVFLGPIHALAFKNNTANATVSIVKKGDWLLNGFNFSGGNADGVHSTFTNESGDLTCRAMFLGTCANTDVKFYHRAGTMTAGGIGSDAGQFGVCLASSDGAKTAYLEISGGLVKNTGDKSNLSIGDGSHTGSSTVYVTGNGEYRAEAGYVRVGGSSRGTLTIDDNGRVIASDKGVIFCLSSSCVAGRDSFLNLNGGTLETTTVTYGIGAANATFTFNGGTLKALQAGTLIEAKPKLTVTVGAGGGTIDSGNYAIAIGEDLGGTGGMTFTGGNTITLNGAVSYTGKTAVTPGTILAVANATAKSNILANGLVLAGLPTADQTVMTYTSALDDADLDKVSCPLAPAATFKFSDETKTAIVVDDPGTVLDNYWTGEANDGNLSNAANWKSGVPTSGNANIFCATNSMLTKGATFAPTSITFLEGSAAVTIDGGAISGITAVTNLSSVVQTFANQVTFADTYRVHCATQPVNFAGGATATYPDASITDDTAASHTLKGAITFTQNWTIPLQPSGKPFVVAENSVVTGKVLSAETYNAGQPDLRIDEGAVATFEAVNSSDTLNIRMNGGRLVSTGDFTTLKGDIGYCYAQPNLGTIEANGLYKSAASGSGYITLYVTNFVIGAGGFGMKHRDWAFRFTADSKITAKNDFTIYKPEDGTSDSDWGLNLQSHTLTIDTAGHTVTFDSYVSNNAGSIVKEGEGELIMQGIRKQYTGGTTVKGGTLTVKGSDTVGTGAMTLGDGTTLEYTNSGNTLAFPFSALVLPSEGKATLRINGERLKSGDHVLVSSVPAGAADLLDVELAETVKDGRKYEVAVKDGNLVLYIRPKGFILSFR